MGGKTQASALRCLPFGTLEVSQEKEKFSRFHNQKTLLFVLIYSFFRAMQPIFMVKRSTFLCFTYLLNYFRIIQL